MIAIGIFNRSVLKLSAVPQAPSLVVWTVLIAGIRRNGQGGRKYKKIQMRELSTT
jgi:hypothetical protein